MPTYSYKCKSCSHAFDVWQSMLENTLTDCPECKGSIYRVIGKNVGIQFSGSGFYINDSKPSPVTDSKTPAKTKTPAADKKAAS